MFLELVGSATSSSAGRRLREWVPQEPGKVINSFRDADLGAHDEHTEAVRLAPLT